MQTRSSCVKANDWSAESIGRLAHGLALKGFLFGNLCREKVSGAAKSSGTDANLWLVLTNRD